jgi:tRNA (cytidine32/uridine32-2'-O)-methyltransferase
MNPLNEFVQIVLVETSHPGNIGSVARAMKNMGISRLALINPKKFPHDEATALAGNAGDILEQAQVFSSIEEAVKNSKIIFATSARERTIEWPVASAKDAAQEINQLAEENIEVSILFGREDRGLTNEELQLSNKHLIIPADPEYPVLNIAMSTQVVCYELYQASLVLGRTFLNTLHRSSSILSIILTKQFLSLI